MTVNLITPVEEYIVLTRVVMIKPSEMITSVHQLKTIRLRFKMKLLHFSHSQLLGLDETDCLFIS